MDRERGSEYCQERPSQQKYSIYVISNIHSNKYNKATTPSSLQPISLAPNAHSMLAFTIQTSLSTPVTFGFLNPASQPAKAREVMFSDLMRLERRDSGPLACLTWLRFDEVAMQCLFPDFCNGMSDGESWRVHQLIFAILASGDLTSTSSRSCLR